MMMMMMMMMMTIELQPGGTECAQLSVCAAEGG
jgi:hypothetical protein